MNIMVTGTSGFIGSHLHSLYPDVLKTFRSKDDSNIDYSSQSVIIVPNITGVTNWSGKLLDVDVIIHLAGLAHSNSYTIENYQSVNVDGSLHFASEAAKAGVKRFVFVSSIAVNGTKTNQLSFSTTSDVNPHNAFAQSKYDAEVGLKRIAEETGLEVVIVRPTLVYGLNAPGNFGSLTKLVKKFPFLPFGLSDNKRDFIAVQNLADLLITCANHPNAAGQTFLASDGETVSIKVFTNAIAKGLNKTLIQLPVPISLMRLGARLVGKLSIAEQLLGNLQVDSSNAHEVLGWSPPYTMEQAMASLSERKK
tara:strand:- start:53096 stop:54019 length:924 start_codon:yes stop_codon:yes gene_type:complete